MIVFFHFMMTTTSKRIRFLSFSYSVEFSFIWIPFLSLIKHEKLGLVEFYENWVIGVETRSLFNFSSFRICSRELKFSYACIVGWLVENASNFSLPKYIKESFLGVFGLVWICWIGIKFYWWVFQYFLVVLTLWFVTYEYISTVILRFLHVFGIHQRLYLSKS